MATSRRYEMDMTRGPLLPQVLMFSLPLIASGILQLLFNAADMMVVGRFSGDIAEKAVAAVGSTSSLINLLVNVFMGLSVGGSVCVARAFGAGDHAAVHKGVHTAISVAGISGLLSWKDEWWMYVSVALLLIACVPGFVVLIGCYKRIEKEHIKKMP